jgi:ACS family tartrate transporter-like MFS transporter
LGERTQRRVTLRLMPFLMLVYLFAYIDRANISIAKLKMQGDLGFDDSLIGFGAGIFFIGYFLLEVPSTLIVERWSARRLLSLIMIVWGVVAAACGFIETRQQFVVLRFLLGAAESGFFPGVIVYISHWYRIEDRARAKTYFMMTQPIAIVTGYAVSRLILETAHWQGLASWRWVFILEGIPPIVLGVFSFFYLTDRPTDAHWLSHEEQAWLNSALTNEARERESQGRVNVTAALRNPYTLLLILIYFFIVSGNQGLIFFLPSVVDEMKQLSVTTRTVMTMLPYVLGIFSIMLGGLSAQRSGERRWHVAIPMLFSALMLTLAILAGEHISWVLACFILAAGTSQAYLPAFWTLPSSYLGKSAAATAVGLINSFGSLGGFVGPYAFGYLRTATGGWHAGLWALSGCCFVSGLLATAIRHGSKLHFEHDKT